jgi:hypothetical protein
MKLILDREFNTRAELDDFVRSRIGEDSKENMKHEMELTAEEGSKLALDKNTRFFGVRVVIK